jgi:hypothetical protein
MAITALDGIAVCLKTGSPLFAQHSHSQNRRPQLNIFVNLVSPPSLSTHVCGTAQAVRDMILVNNGRLEFLRAPYFILDSDDSRGCCTCTARTTVFGRMTARIPAYRIGVFKLSLLGSTYGCKPFR